MQNQMIEYVERQKRKGNLGQIAKKVIMNTGSHIFVPIKYQFYGIRNREYELFKLEVASP